MGLELGDRVHRQGTRDLVADQQQRLSRGAVLGSNELDTLGTQVTHFGNVGLSVNREITGINVLNEAG